MGFLPFSDFLPLSAFVNLNFSFRGFPHQNLERETRIKTIKNRLSFQNAGMFCYSSDESEASWKVNLSRSEAF